MLTESFIQVTGAYGRTYKTMSEVWCDWINGKDFRIHGLSTYINRRDWKNFSPNAKILIKMSTGWETIYGPTDAIPDYAFLRPDGDIIYCYGPIRDDSNFSIVCDDEEYDGIWADGDPESPEGYFKSWGPCVKYLLKHYRADISQIEAC